MLVQIETNNNRIKQLYVRYDIRWYYALSIRQHNNNEMVKITYLVWVKVKQIIDGQLFVDI